MHPAELAAHCKAWLFDLDGTLLDSFPVHFHAYQVTFGHFGIAVTEATYLRHYSPDWFEVYRAFGLPEAAWAEADAIWLAEAARHEPALFPQTTALLTRLHGRTPLGLVTAGSRERVQRDLRRTGIGRFFDTIITGDDVARPKPAPDALHQALAAVGVPPAAACYVGDTHVDYATARAAGAHFIGVTGPLAHALHGDGYPTVTTVAELLPLFDGEAA